MAVRSTQGQIRAVRSTQGQNRAVRSMQGGRGVTLKYHIENAINELWTVVYSIKLYYKEDIV